MKKIVVLCLCAFVIGGALVWVVPPAWTLALIAAPFITCIGLSLYVAFENGAFDRNRFSIFFGAFKPFTPVRSSRAFRGLLACGCLIAGVCLALLVKMQYA
jgi:hypothetical protein